MRTNNDSLEGYADLVILVMLTYLIKDVINWNLKTQEPKIDTISWMSIILGINNIS